MSREVCLGREEERGAPKKGVGVALQGMRGGGVEQESCFDETSTEGVFRAVEERRARRCLLNQDKRRRGRIPMLKSTKQIAWFCLACRQGSGVQGGFSRREGSEKGRIDWEKI